MDKKTFNYDILTKKQALEVIPVICEHFKIDPLELLLGWVLYEFQKTEHTGKKSKKKKV